MASTSAISPVVTAVLAKLQADAPLLVRVPVARITDEPSARPVYPYVLVESSGEQAFDTMGDPTLPKFGSIAGLRVRIVSQYRGTAEGAEVLSLVKAVLDGQPLTVAGYASVSVDFQNATLLVDFAAVVTRELVADFNVTVHQS